MTEMQANDPKVKKVVRKRLRKEYGNRPPPQQRPGLSVYHGCTRPAHETGSTSAVNTVFGRHFLALQLTPTRRQYRQLDLISTLSVTTRWREAILSHSNGLSEPVRRMLSGHDAKGGPAILVFDEPVCGPILVGAGRFRGYGFCRPLGGED